MTVQVRRHCPTGMKLPFLAESLSLYFIQGVNKRLPWCQICEKYNLNKPHCESQSCNISYGICG
jgi:hypothetical protein